MSRPRRGSSSSPLSLFPFPAGFISAIGAPLLLLLAIDRRAAANAIATAIGPLTRRASAEEEQLTQRRRELAGEVATHRQAIRVLDAEEQRIEQQLRLTDEPARAHTARIAAARAELTRLAEASGRIAADADRIRRKLELVEAERARVATELENAVGVFVPVVHPGSHATARRPIYIECTAAAVVIEPERIILPPMAMAGDRDGDTGFVAGECRQRTPLRLVPSGQRAAGICHAVDRCLRAISTVPVPFRQGGPSRGPYQRLFSAQPERTSVADGRR